MQFSEFLSTNEIGIFDGAMGTLLQSRGLKPGQSPEEFGLKSRDAVMEVHTLYLEAGAGIITTNTFGGTRCKLNSNIDPVDFNRTMAALARRAAGDKAFVAGSVGPTGRMLAPLGDASFLEILEAFKEQIRGLVQGGVDLILGETHMDLAEARAVVMAARSESKLPVAISMTFEKGISLTGTSPEVFADTMQNLGADVIAINCSSGPEDFVPLIRAMLPRLNTPLLIEPNAGIPELENGQTVFKVGPEEFAEKLKVFPELGVKFLGGCCGTTPKHIKALSRMASGLEYKPAQPRDIPSIVLTSRTRSVPLGFACPPVLIGERINPTGKSDLADELKGFCFTRAMKLAEEQSQAGAGVLDVNVGAAMVDEEKVLPALCRELVSRLDIPLCVDSSSIRAIYGSLLEYPGSALVNSISGEKDKLEVLGPICRDFGAPFILLPLQSGRMPGTAGERLQIIEKLLDRADQLNIPRRLILVDVLIMTVSSHPRAALECLDTIRYCRDKLGLGTVAGLSNISFGLPARDLINSGFLSMALAHGLISFIGDPHSTRLNETLAASNVLLGHDPQAGNFTRDYAGWTPAGEYSPKPLQTAGSFESTIQEAVVKGRKDDIIALLKQEVDSGRDPFELVNSEMIPGINQVGEQYEKRTLFLPQLILSAETMKTGFEYLHPLLQQDQQKKGPTVIMATVEGDIHDIGKNIVCLMLRNYGFHVVDLGIDVPADEIMVQARKHRAGLIGLSALMTTTMSRMEECLELLHLEKIDSKVMIGGAVVTRAYADRIGAHGYASDAVSAVKTAQKLCSLRQTAL